MLVGEQPGNDEDLAGRPFVGPAGRLLDRALQDAGIDRADTFITNAVKHFKFEPRGKRRLHKRPNPDEIEACRWWINLERDLVRPRLVLALGATAVRALLGRNITVREVRGKVLPLQDDGSLLATVHPSFLLRIRDAPDRARECSRFVADLRAAQKFVQTGATRQDGVRQRPLRA
jgi:DNA polymerase